MYGKLIRLIYLAVVLAVFVPGLASAQSAKQKAKIEQEIKKLDLAHADAVLRGDLAALGQTLDGRFQGQQSV